MVKILWKSDRQEMTTLFIFLEKKMWFYMKYIGKIAERESYILDANVFCRIQISFIEIRHHYKLANRTSCEM